MCGATESIHYEDHKLVKDAEFIKSGVALELRDSPYDVIASKSPFELCGFCIESLQKAFAKEDFLAKFGDFIDDAWKEKPDTSLDV